MKTDPKCPNCSGAPLFLTCGDKRVQVKCGHAMCQEAEEGRIAARVLAATAKAAAPDVVGALTLPENLSRLMASIMRHLPVDLARGAKR
jgi:hypothetical protein